MGEIHGGDVYRNRVNIDFSVNVNPLGMPETVEAALYEAVEECKRYPDIQWQKLKEEVSRMLNIPKEYLLFGNGASELFLACVHGIKPKKTVIPVPSFYGYEYAADAVDGEIIYYEMKEKTGFSLEEDFFRILTEDVDLLFLANPNNPTGKLLSKDFVRNLLNHCTNKGIYLVLDECFIEFCDKDYSLIADAEKSDHLILVRAFTKIFAIPGVRLGYLICSNPMLLKKIKRQLPEWNVSGFAQSAGIACASETAFIEKTADYVKKERQFLERELEIIGITVFPGAANFLLLYCEKDLYGKLLNKGILIRDCENFKGLSRGFYRIAVKTRKENEILLKTIGEINWKIEKK